MFLFCLWFWNDFGGPRVEQIDFLEVWENFRGPEAEIFDFPLVLE